MITGKGLESTVLSNRAIGLNHIGIIMDGNRRFAKRLMLEPWKGHEWGSKKFEEVLDWCMELGIKHVTLYALSLENLSGRPREELDFLFKLMKDVAKGVVEDKNHKVRKNKVRVSVIGRTELLPQDLQDLIRKTSELTKNYSDFFLNFCVAYGGRQEIAEAFKKIMKKIAKNEITADDINDDVIRDNLYTSGVPDPDLIIRTGGEKRLSNFLLFQSAYSELYFTDKTWPEFGKEDFLDAIKDFQDRQRRFGK